MTLRRVFLCATMLGCAACSTIKEPDRAADAGESFADDGDAGGAPVEQTAAARSPARSARASAMHFVGGGQPNAMRPQVADAQAPSAAGYVHTIAMSKFRIGAGVATELDTPTLRRWRGTLGAFATDPTNGWSMALLDASTPTGPYDTDPVVHAAAVQAYFTSAGLPADQILSTGSYFEVEGGGQVGQPESPSSQVTSVTTVLYRGINGIRVVDSYAWAKMTTTGGTDMESVFWPTLDVATVEAAMAFAASASNASWRAGFLASLPGTVYRDGGVVIHHSGPGIHAAVLTFATYDVALDSAPSAAMRHFLVSGAEVRLPQEQVE